MNTKYTQSGILYTLAVLLSGLALAGPALTAGAADCVNCMAQDAQNTKVASGSGSGPRAYGTFVDDQYYLGELWGPSKGIVRAQQHSPSYGGFYCVELDPSIDVKKATVLVTSRPPSFSLPVNTQYAQARLFGNDVGQCVNNGFVNSIAVVIRDAGKGGAPAEGSFSILVY